MDHKRKSNVLGDEMSVMVEGDCCQATCYTVDIVLTNSQTHCIASAVNEVDQKDRTLADIKNK